MEASTEIRNHVDNLTSVNTPPVAAFSAHSLLNVFIQDDWSENDRDFAVLKLSRISGPVWKTKLADVVIEFVKGRKKRSAPKPPNTFGDMMGDMSGLTYMKSVAAIEEIMKEYSGLE